MKRFTATFGTAMLVSVPIQFQRAQAQTTETPATGPAVTLQALTSGTYPLSMKLKELDKDWRRVSIAVQGENNPMAIFGLGGAVNDVYYTNNQMVRLGSETFIVAYREPPAAVDFTAMMRNPMAAGKPPENLTPETTLSLALLNLRSVSSLKNIAAFDLKSEIARRNAEIEDARQKLVQAGAPVEQAQAAASASMSNLKQLGLGILQYAQDHNQTFPPLGDAGAMKKEVMAYVKSEALFVHPGSKEAYQPNSSLSGKKLSSLAEPNSRVLAFEASAGTDGRRAILYADGHVKRIAESDWPDIKKASQVP